jgi:hypothetical protein
LWDVVNCKLVDRYHYLGETCCLHVTKLSRKNVIQRRDVREPVTLNRAVQSLGQNWQDVYEEVKWVEAESK